MGSQSDGCFEASRQFTLYWTCGTMRRCADFLRATRPAQ